MARTVIRKFVAWDVAASVGVPVESGVIIESCRILRDRTSAGVPEIYVVEFESAGRRLCCPLVDFQARTRIDQPVRVAEITAREAARIA